MPKFSVIIPLFNKESFIEKTIRSVLNQTFDDYELLIINDGSTDGSENKVLRFKDKRINYYFQENQGASSTRNLGILKAKGDFITFLDADDYWYADFLETLTIYISKFPQHKVFATAIEVETPKSVFKAEYSINKTNNFEIVNYFTASLKQSVICTSSAAFERTVFSESVGVFDTSIKSGQDVDLWIRVGLKHEIVFIWKIGARYVYDEKSLSRNITSMSYKSDFTNYENFEKNNPSLKKYIDHNRFSMAVKSKTLGDLKSFKLYYNAIDLNNLSLRKKVLIHLPLSFLKFFIQLKFKLAEWGLGKSVFK